MDVNNYVSVTLNFAMCILIVGVKNNVSVMFDNLTKNLDKSVKRKNTQQDSNTIRCLTPLHQHPASATALAICFNFTYLTVA